jgi:hypothetical protein
MRIGRLSFKLSLLYYNIKHFIINIFTFIPALWNYRNWDFGYVLQFNKFILGELYHSCYINGHAQIKGKQDIRLLACINLLDRLHKDKYHSVELDEIDKKFGKSNYGCYREKDEKYFSFVDYRYKSMSERTKAEYKKAIKNARLKEEYMYNQDLELLLKYIKKYHKQWWD